MQTVARKWARLLKGTALTDVTDLSVNMIYMWKVVISSSTRSPGTLSGKTSRKLSFFFVCMGEKGIHLSAGSHTAQHCTVSKVGNELISEMLIFYLMAGCGYNFCAPRAIFHSFALSWCVSTVCHSRRFERFQSPGIKHKMRYGRCKLIHFSCGKWKQLSRSRGGRGSVMVFQERGLCLSWIS